MSRVDKLHKNKNYKKRSNEKSSMDDILGKNARNINSTKLKNNKKNKNRKSVKKKSSLKSFMAIIVIFLVLFAGAFAAFHFLTSGFFTNNIPFIPTSETFNNGEATILILGTDGRDDVDGDRSDTIILCRFNFKDGYVRMISIPRDTRVPIPGHNKNRINAAYAFGGAELTKKTIEDFYNLKIDRTMEVSFTSFTEAVDKLGGVEIVWEDEPLVNEDYNINMQPGINKLDAEKALSFVRFRDTPTADLGRIGRQQLFLKSLARDIKNQPNILKQIDIINSIYKDIKTDVSLSEMLYMFNSFKEFDNFKITTWMSVGTLGNVDGASVVIPEDNVAELARGFLDGDLVASSDKEGAIFPELITVEEKAIEIQKKAKKIADENSK